MKYSARHVVGYRFNDDGYPKEKQKSSKPKKPITKKFLHSKLIGSAPYVYIELKINSIYSYMDFVEYFKKGGIPVYTTDTEAIGTFSFRPFEYVKKSLHIQGSKYYVLSVPKDNWINSDDKLKLLSELYPKKHYPYLYDFTYPSILAKNFTNSK